jgi:uroporphyrinogen-III synthase
VRLLLTRPEPEAQRTAAHLRAHGHQVVIAPLLRIEPVGDAEIGAGPWAALIVTSANAAAAAAHPRFAALRPLPVFAVGARSAAAMREAGFADVTSADGDVSDLIRVVTERLEGGAALLYLAGAERAGDLAGSLSARGFAVCTSVVYRAVKVGALPPSAVAALSGGIDGVLYFSRRSAEAYVDAVRAAGLSAAALTKPAHFCLSAQVAGPLAQAGAANVHIAPQPTEASLIDLIPSA